MKRFFYLLQRMIRMGTDNELQMHREGELMLSIPILLFLLLACIGFWLIIPLMVVGLFCGCSYSFSGKELGKDVINRGMGKANHAVDALKQEWNREFPH